MNRHLIDLLLKFISFMKDTYFKKTEFLFKNDEFPKEKKINIENVYIAKNCMNENLFLFLQGEYYILVETLFNDYFDQNNINEKFFDVKEFESIKSMIGAEMENLFKTLANNFNRSNNSNLTGNDDQMLKVFLRVFYDEEFLYSSNYKCEVEIEVN